MLRFTGTDGLNQIQGSEYKLLDFNLTTGTLIYLRPHTQKEPFEIRRGIYLLDKANCQLVESAKEL